MVFDRAKFNSQVKDFKKSSPNAMISSTMLLYKATIISVPLYDNDTKSIIKKPELWIMATGKRRATSDHKIFCFKTHFFLSLYYDKGLIEGDFRKIANKFLDDGNQLGSYEPMDKLHAIATMVCDAINNNDIYALISFDTDHMVKFGRRLKRFDLVDEPTGNYPTRDECDGTRELYWGLTKAQEAKPHYSSLREEDFYRAWGRKEFEEPEETEETEETDEEIYD